MKLELGSTRPKRAFQMGMELLIGVVIVYGLVVVAAPAAQWTCERAAQLACGSAPVKKAMSSGNGFWGSCRMECGDATGKSDDGR